MSGMVLIVENEGNTAASMRGFLSARGFEVSVARNGEEGVWRSVTENPAVVILDARLPYLSGWDACAEIKSARETRHIPVIILARDMSARSRARSVLARSDACLPKPVDPARCVKLMEYLLRKGMRRA